MRKNPVPDGKAISHRGRGNFYADNTYEALKASYKKGFAGVEFDIRITKDNIIVLFHDETLTGIPLKSLTYKEANRIAKKNGFKIPKFETILNKLGGKIKFDIEFKEAGYERQAIALIRNYLHYNDYIITSFYPDVVKAIRQVDSHIQLGLIIGKESYKKHRFAVASVFIMPSKLKSLGISMLAIEDKMLKWGFKQRIVKTGFKLLVWTIRDRKSYNKYINDKDVSAVITDIIVL